MIDVLINITGSVANIPDCQAGNAHEHNVRELVFATDWSEDAEGYTGTPLIKTIVFVTPSGIELAPAVVTNNTVLLESSMLDGAGWLQFTLYGKVSGVLTENASGSLQVSAALSDLGGVAPAVYADITSDCIDATSASLAQTGLCEAAAQGATDITATVQGSYEAAETARDGLYQAAELNRDSEFDIVIGLANDATALANTAASNADASQSIKVTQAEYDLIAPDPDKIYFIVG